VQRQDVFERADAYERYVGRRTRLPVEADGTIRMTSRALSVRGTGR